MKVNIKGIELSLESHPSLFSPSLPDEGTLEMLNVCNFNADDKVLDLGCGYGLVGIYAAKIVGGKNVFMTDINETAVNVSQKNAIANEVSDIKIYLGDAYDAIDEKDFSVILSNPPYHSDFSIAKRFIEKGFNRLKIGGSLYMVTKRVDWYKNKLQSVFGGISVVEKEGYSIFKATKKSMIRNDIALKNNKKAKKGKLREKD